MLTFIAILSCLFSYAQLNISLPNNVIVQLPKGVVWYNDSTYTNRLADNLEVRRPKTNFYKYTYKVNNMTLKFREIASISDQYIINLQRALNSVNKQQTIIKEINGNHLLIDASNQNNIGNYRFYCLNSNYTAGITGIITYNTSNNSNEHYLNIINDILKSIKFVK